MTAVKLKSLYPPVCVYGDYSKSWYIIAGGKWVPVSRRYEWAEIKEMWEPITFADTPKPTEHREVKNYQVEGSKSNVYTVTDDNGIWTCSCPAHGFGRGKDCKHIKQLKDDKK
jgi:hypothetical protein